LPPDAALLSQFCQDRCGRSFQSLVTRHVGWVASLVRRQVGDAHLAEDVTQAVFIILARKAHTIPRDTPLSAWLFRVARYASRDAVKRQVRHRKRMQQVMEMRRDAVLAGDPEPISPADALGPELDEAIACLNDADRQVVLLRFFEDKPLAEVGKLLGISEVAARKRASRALKRLRELLIRRGFRIGTMAAIGLLLLRETRSASAATTTAAPIAKAVLGSIASSHPSMQIADGAIRAMWGAQFRLLAAMSSVAVAFFLGIGVMSTVTGQSVFTWYGENETPISINMPGPLPVPDVQPATEKPKPPAINQMWIGGANAIAMPILPRANANSSLPLRSLSSTDHPVAVVQDQQQQWWYRKVDADEESVLRGTAYGVRDETGRTIHDEITIDVLDRLLAQQMADQGRLRVDPMDASGWIRLDGPSDDGVVVVPLRTNEFDTQFLEQTLPEFQIKVVPEPIGIVWIAGGLLLLRRRRSNS
jgi:RNA polymerase sigma factor (sigma-70 family)